MDGNQEGKQKEKQARRQYYAKEFCNITGLKSDTLRFYVDKGLLNPTINPENQYRTYSSRDVVDMAFVRSRRAMGVPIFGINEVLTKLSTEEQLSWYADHERELEKQIAELQMKLNRCRKAQRDLKNLHQFLNQIADKSKDDGPNVYQLHLIGPNVPNTEKRFQLAEQWRESCPHLLPMIHIPKEELEEEERERYSVTYGLALPEWMLEGHYEMVESPAYLYPTEDNVGMMIRVEDPFIVTRSDMKLLLDYIREKGYRITNDMTSWLFARTVEEGREYYYFATRISVDKRGVGQEKESLEQK